MNSILKKSLSCIMVFCLMFLCLGLSVKVNAVTNNYVEYTDELVDGEYIIYYNGKAMNTTVTSSRLQYVEITPVGNTISTDDASIIWQISKNGDYWTIYNSAVNKYAAGTGAKNTAQMLASNEEDYSLWSLEYKNGTYDFINKRNADAGVNKTLRNNGTYGFACYSTSTGGSLSLYKLSNEAVEPAIVIDANSSYTKVNGDKVNFTCENVGLENPVISWKSSDSNVATIDNGVLTAVSMGTTTISASANGVVSNEIEIKVYPDNTNPITIAEAIEICKFVGNNDSAYKYTIIGEIVYDELTSKYFITDGYNEILVYNIKNVSAGDKVQVNGYLKYYENSTYQINAGSGATITKYYSVTFDSNGGSDVSPLEVEVLEGTTISTPTEPTNEGYSLAGWYNGNSQWNFATDTVTSNITLTAKWVLSNLETVFADLNNVDAYMSMAYSYNINGEIKTDELNRDFTGVSATSYAEWSGKTSNSTAVYAGQSAGSYGSIQLKSKDSISGIVTTTSGGYARKITVQWNSNTTASRTLDIYGSNTAYTSASDLYGDSKGTKLGSIVFETSTELVIEGDYQYIGIRSNSGALYLDSISIEWSTVVITEMYSNMEFRLGAGIDKDIADLASQLDNAKYGIEVSDGEKTEKYYSSESLFKNNLDNDIFYVVISLGDIFNNKERVDVEFSVKAFIEYDGDTYYSSLSKTYSVKTLVEKYLSDDATKEAVQPLKEALENLGYIFE